MKILIRLDMEGLTGVTCYDEVWPGKPLYERHRDVLTDELLALCEGLGEARIVTFDEHHEGRNVRVERLPRGVTAICGKPRYEPDWPGGLDDSVDALMMLGFHSMAETPGGTLAHTYEHDIAALEVNGVRVGEVGLEAALAGELGIPMILYTGDSAGADEARALIPGLRCVVTKQSLGETAAACRPLAAVLDELHAVGRELAGDRARWPAPLALGRPVRLVVTLREGPYRAVFAELFPELLAGVDTVVLSFNTLAEAWARYWWCKERAQAAVRQDGA